jgi:hypothetical protein
LKTLIEIVIFALIGTGVGYLYRDIQEKIKGIHKKIDDQKDLGAVGGEYGGLTQVSTNLGPVGLVETKTPSQLEWEESERLRTAQLNVKVK